ncbi:MAG TPA: Nudix family hydrolase [Cellvibrio sp.]|nr:Nudix family hydrolase [Cellvibrio sp.]
MTKLIHVAVGVIVGDDGRILIAKRSQTAHQGGLWEFPGGKVDDGENIHQALMRELQEELTINVVTSEPLIQIRHHYPDKSVLLDVYKVSRFTGEPCGAEGQPICWVAPKDLHKFEFPAANQPIIKAITLNDRLLITGDFIDCDDFLARLSNALEKGIRLVQLRVLDLSFSTHKLLLENSIKLTEQFSADVIINTSVETFEQIISAFPGTKIGLHLNRHHAVSVSSRPISANCLLGVSCHDEQEIHHAQQIGADYLLLSPVKETRSHPNVEPIGWVTFASFVKLANIPVYALGGVNDQDLTQAKQTGAQGVAAISAWW